MFFRLLPWEYAIRNLFRRPLRTLLTFAGLTTVIVLVLVVVGFILWAALGSLRLVLSTLVTLLVKPQTPVRAFPKKNASCC